MPRSKKPSSRAARPRAVLYARVSSKDQEKEGFSIPAQKRLLQDYADAQGIQIAAEFIDVETARKAGRTAFGEMLDYLKKKRSRCPIVLVEKTDRLYRNLRDWVTLDELDLEIHLVKENVVLSDDSRSSEKFMHGIKVLMAKNYIDNLSEETSKGMREKAEQGIWPSMAPVGYRNAARQDGKKVIEPDPEMAPLVANLFEKYAFGTSSIREIAAWAKEQNLRRSGAKRALGRAAVHQTLRNPIYMGEFVWNGRRYSGVHEPLITKQLFDRVQDVMDGRKPGTVAQPRHRQFPYSGLVYCGRCHDEGERRLLIATEKKKTWVYYRCERCKEAKRADWVREERLEAAFAAQLDRLHLRPDVLEYLVGELRALHAEKNRFRDDEIAKLQRQYGVVQGRIDAAYEDRLDGRITPAFFDRKARGWRLELERIRRDMQAHQDADQEFQDDGSALLELASKAGALFRGASLARKRRLLEFVNSNSLWRGDGVEMTWRQPFGILVDSIAVARTADAAGGGSDGVCPVWLPGGDRRQNLGDEVLGGT
jgi:site-specific DNA recombinase